MGTSIIDGTIEEAKLKRARAGTAVFESIRFQLDGGGARTVTKAVVKQTVADELKPGVRGRFYQFNAFDLSGIHGVRRDNGTAVYGFPGNNAKLFLIISVINLLWIVFKLSVDGEIPLLGLGLLILGIVGYIFMSKGEREAKAQFESDTGYAPAAAPAAPEASV